MVYYAVYKGTGWNNNGNSTRLEDHEALRAANILKADYKEPVTRPNIILMLHHSLFSVNGGFVGLDQRHNSLSDITLYSELEKGVIEISKRLQLSTPKIVLQR